MITRDAVQGFIDGHKLSHGDKGCLPDCCKKWIISHSKYPLNENDAEKVISDLSSYSL